MNGAREREILGTGELQGWVAESQRGEPAARSKTPRISGLSGAPGSDGIRGGLDAPLRSRLVGRIAPQIEIVVYTYSGSLMGELKR
uniref:Uncharacterized protein n=1 Tax=Solibacter usitatus (strain Ellin6076) TaxID=234267 RepID=Q01V00_SOLUE